MLNVFGFGLTEKTQKAFVVVYRGLWPKTTAENIPSYISTNLIYQQRAYLIFF